jgi:hypothetical protein
MLLPNEVIVPVAVGTIAGVLYPRGAIPARTVNLLRK